MMAVALAIPMKPRAAETAERPVVYTGGLSLL